jgi:uncharacterized lipoprotein YmbA
MGHRGVVRGLLTLLASIALASCAVSDPTQYYTLDQTMAGPAETQARASTPAVSATGAKDIGIGIGPMIMPGYLDRIQIVTRTGTDQVDISVFHRWAEPLEDGMARILANEIGARVPTDRIVIFPWRGVVAQALRYQVVVAVMRFDGPQGGDITLDTRWRILGTDGNELAFRRTTVTEPAVGRGYEPMIAAMHRALVTLGQEIAAEIQPLVTLEHGCAAKILSRSTTRGNSGFGRSGKSVTFGKHQGRHCSWLAAVRPSGRSGVAVTGDRGRWPSPDHCAGEDPDRSSCSNLVTKPSID